MRLTTVILIATFLQVSANSLAQKISLSKTNAPLKSIFKEIKAQSGFNFIYSDELMLHAKKVSIQANNEELGEVLGKIFAEQPFSYEVDSKTVLIKEKGFLDKASSVIGKIVKNLVAIDLRGKVVDENGNPLPGASVKAGGKVVVTDGNGEFFIKDIEEGSNVEVSYIGFVTANEKALAKYMTIVLKEAAADLKEVVVNKGYYTTNKQLNTGSTSTFSAKDIEKHSVNNILNALEGNIPGLQITQVSGVPGADLKISLRGQNSISNGNDPLFVVDGVPFNSKSFGAGANTQLSAFTALRPEDIETVVVLKDADATAIYGSRGANGVVLITTKTGKANKQTITANIYSGVYQVNRRLDLMNNKEYLMMRREAFKNDGRLPTSVDVNGTWDTTRNVDWQKEMIGRAAPVTNVSTNLSGGGENTQFYMGLSYRIESTVFPGKYSNRSGSSILSINHKSKDSRFRADWNTNYSLNRNELPINDFTSFIFRAPNSPKFYNEDGSYNWENNTWSNPLAETEISTTLRLRNFISNGILSYKLTPELEIKNNIGYTLNNGMTSRITPFSAANPAIWSNPSEFRRNDRTENQTTTWIVEPQINFGKCFGDHNLETLAGLTFQRTDGEVTGLSVSGFPSDALVINSAAGNIVASRGFSKSEYKYAAIYSRIGYNFKQRYIINITARRDGSSRFGEGKQFGNFGAVGVAWIFSKERFAVDNIPFLSSGKFKASMGRTGNDQITDYQYLSTYIPQGGLSYSRVGILLPENLSNPQYGWETINKIESSIELGFFNDRLLFNLNYYRHRTSNQLVGFPLPSTTGFTSVIANLPAVIQNKGLEFELNTTNYEKGAIKWTTSANFSIPNNKLVKYPNLEGSPFYGQYSVGEPLSIQFGYVFTGINPQTGVYTYADLNSDGVITSTQDRIPIFYGSKFSGGISNVVSYKSLTIDFMLHYTKQFGNNAAFYSPPGLINLNQPRDLLDRWTNTNTSGRYQRFTSTGGSVYNAATRYPNSNVAASDNSFLRLRNVMLSWSIPKKILKPLQINTASVYLQGQNLFVITGFKGLDPETSQRSSFVGLPPLRALMAGIKIII